MSRTTFFFSRKKQPLGHRYPRRFTLELKSLSEVGRLLGIQTHRLTYCHHIGALPEPTRVCGRRAYSDTDIDRIAHYFDRKDDRHRHQGRLRLGELECGSVLRVSTEA